MYAAVVVLGLHFSHGKDHCFLFKEMKEEFTNTVYVCGTLSLQRSFKAVRIRGKSV